MAKLKLVGRNPTASFVVADLLLLDLTLGNEGKPRPWHGEKTSRLDRLTGDLADAVSPILELADGVVDLFEHFRLALGEPEREVRGERTGCLIRFVAAFGRDVFLGAEILRLNAVDRAEEIASALQQPLGPPVARAPAQWQAPRLRRCRTCQCSCGRRCHRRSAP